VPILSPAHPLGGGFLIRERLDGWFGLLGLAYATFNNIQLYRRVERLPPSSHVKEPRVTAHYEHYTHDEWSIGDLLHWLNSPSQPGVGPF
jgi:hypothetical protein